VVVVFVIKLRLIPSNIIAFTIIALFSYFNVLLDKMFPAATDLDFVLQRKVL
jgi:hypothetical protein